MDEIIDRLKKVRRGAMFIIEAPSGNRKKRRRSKKFCNVTRISNFPFLSPRANPARAKLTAKTIISSMTNSMMNFWHKMPFTNMSIPNTALATARCAPKSTALST